MATTPKAPALASLIEHESCQHLKHPKCWNSSSRLRSPREEGAGLGQITRAFRQDGSIRFDALQELRQKYPKELQEANWNSIYTRPDLQIRMVVLKMRDNYQYYKPHSHTWWQALAFSDAAYNGGRSGVDSERRACKLASWCDHTQWFDNVEKLCLKSKAALYGTRSACDINRHHVRDVLETRLGKYEKIWQY